MKNISPPSWPEVEQADREIRKSLERMAYNAKQRGHHNAKERGNQAKQQLQDVPDKPKHTIRTEKRHHDLVWYGEKIRDVVGQCGHPIEVKVTSKLVGQKAASA